MKKFVFLSLIFWIISCSSDAIEPEIENQPEEEVIVEEENTEEEENVENEEEEEEEEEIVEEEEQQPQRQIPFDISVFTQTGGMTQKYDIIQGDPINVNNPLNLSVLLDIPNTYRFKIEGSKFIAWESSGGGPVWTYDVMEKEGSKYVGYFDIGTDFFRDSPCPVPTANNFLTFFHTADNPTNGEYYQAEIYNPKLDEIHLVTIPDEFVPETGCLLDTKNGTGDLVTFYYRLDSSAFSSFWGVIDTNAEEFLTDFELPRLHKFTIRNREVLLFNVAAGEASFKIFDLNLDDYTQNTDIFYSSDYLNSLTNTTSINLNSEFHFKADFEEDKMLFYNGDGDVITSGNISDFQGPSILDLSTGELQILSELRIFQAYSDPSSGRINLEILQSKIDLESETVIVTYYDAGYSSSPYGILFLDFELNLLRHVELGNDMPIAIVKY